MIWFNILMIIVSCLFLGGLAYLIYKGAEMFLTLALMIFGIMPEDTKKDKKKDKKKKQK